MGGSTNVQDEEICGWPAICGEWWSCLKCWPKKLWKTGLCNFRIFMWISAISRTLLYDIITVRLCYHKFCTRWVLKMLMGAHKTQKMASALVLSVIPQRWQWISQSHHTSIRWWNMGFIYECWNQRAGKAVDGYTHIYQTRWKRLNKHCVPARNLMATVFWDVKGMLMIESCNNWPQ
jgi:hypothetical protein